MNDCPYHFQDSRDFCGPACMMMLLESQRVPVNTIYQSALWGELAGFQTVTRRAFATAPEAFAGAVSRRLAGSGVGYAIYPPQPQNSPPPVPMSAGSIITEIKNRLSTFKDHPVLALIEGGKHWVIIYKCDGNDFLICSPQWKETLSEANQAHNSPPCLPCSGGPETVMSLTGLREVLSPVSTSRAPTIYNHQRIIVVPDSAAALPAPPP